MSRRLKAGFIAMVSGVFAYAPTSIFINTMPGYYSLDSCAERPLSTIVRDMSSGCGDNSSTTSFSCFCSASSTQFQSFIAQAVASQCQNDSSEVALATIVFHEYCQIGSSELRGIESSITASADGTQGTAAPGPQASSTVFAAVASTAPSSQTTGVEQSSPDPETASNRRTIIIAVIIPIVTISIGVIGAYFLTKRMSRTAKQFKDSHECEQIFSDGGESSGVLLTKEPMVRAEELHSEHTCELPTSGVTYELPGIVAAYAVR